MDEVYEFRRAPGRGLFVVVTLCVAGLALAVYMTNSTHFLWVVGMGCALTLALMIMPRPVYGIKVNEDFLILSAWRRPRKIPLDQISHLQATNVSDETRFAVVYKDGEYEAIFSLDLPDDETLVEIMAERGIPVRSAL